MAVPRDMSALLLTMNESLKEVGEASGAREQARALASIIHAVRAVGRIIGGQPSAEKAILEYLSLNIGVPVSGGELEAVSGITDYARRIRQLRADGWRIAGGNIVPNSSEKAAMRRLDIGLLRNSDYVLLSLNPKSSAPASRAKAADTEVSSGSRLAA